MRKKWNRKGTAIFGDKAVVAVRQANTNTDHFSDGSPLHFERAAEVECALNGHEDLLSALTAVTHCLQWHVDNNGPVAMDNKALEDARALIKKHRAS